MFAAVRVAAIALVQRRTQVGVFAVMLIIGFMLAVGPWSAQNLNHFGSAELTTSYGGNSLSQRVVYNPVTWAKWRTAFVYYLPDFGDSLACDLWPQSRYQQFGLGPGSYYAEDAPTYDRELIADTGNPDTVAGYLIRHEVLGNLFKHTMVSLPLAVRGIVPGRYWGLLDFVYLIVTTVALLRRGHWLWLVFAIFMAALYAGISVSIPRYNLTLVPVYALAIAVRG